MVSLTIFDNIYDNKTDKRMDYGSFDELEAVLFRLAKSTKYPTKKDAPLISPATYEPDTTRANDNVVGWGGFGILDIDDFTGDIKDIESKYSQYRYLCYSTASSTVEKDNIKHFWFALNKEIGDIADAQTKDLSRMYYVPAQYKNSFNFIFSHDGEIMNPDVLMDKFPYVKPNQTMFDRFPPAIQKALLERKRNELNNTNFTWTSYRDCPFVNKKQVDEYKGITGTGWYAKMYQIMLTTAGNAMSKGYPITAKEIEYICRDLDLDTGSWYQKRDLEKEAARAIDFVFKNNI